MRTLVLVFFTDAVRSLSLLFVAQRLIRKKRLDEDMFSALRLIQDSGSAEICDLRQMQDRFASELPLQEALREPGQIFRFLGRP